MDRCNYQVPHTSWMVEMPINAGQCHQTIASLWISHLVDNLPLSPVMVAHIASAKLTNPRQIADEQSIIICSLVALMFELKTVDSPPHFLTFKPRSH